MKDDRLLEQVAGRFTRVEIRKRAAGFLYALLADLPRKNCWTIAEHAGDVDPHGMQHLLGRASRDTDGVRDDLRDYVTMHLGENDTVPVIDETGDLEKGSMTVRVQDRDRRLQARRRLLHLLRSPHRCAERVLITRIVLNEEAPRGW